MSFYSSKLIVGASFSLLACLVAAHAGLADPLNSPMNPTLSQLNRPPGEDMPQVPTETVRGKITRIGGDRITIETEDGDTETYAIPAEYENREGLEVGNEVILSVKLGVLVDYAVPAPPPPARVIRRETVQPRPTPTPTPAPRPAPTPAPRPAPAPAPAPQPIRGMW